MAVSVHIPAHWRDRTGGRAVVEVEGRNLREVLNKVGMLILLKPKGDMPDVIQELIFHPNATLASTWQPWDGVLGPPRV